MAPDELSEDCKQRLRDLDGGMAQVIEYLNEYDLERAAQLSREILPSFDHASAPDEPCKRALRGIDQTALVRIARLDATLGSEEDVERLVRNLGQVRQRIQAILGTDMMI